ncbi:MAG: toll/interleukin-1 receptor domain-containing protein [Anaerolineae bacterium]|nr:toll/interleukin-1 receptor domain-containing protein [Anaerolineae bacterium]
MVLSSEAQELATYLARAWEMGVIESYFELIDVTAGNAKVIEVAAGLGVLNEDEFNPPSLGVLMELSNYSNGDLVRVSEGITSNGGRKWTVQLTQDLRDTRDFGFSPMSVRGTALDSLPSFFISYRRYEQRFVEQLAEYLRRVYGFDRVWFDTGIYAGQRWWDEIIRQLRHHGILIYVVTREGLQSVYCRAEFTEAWRFGKQVIPLLLRGATFPAILNQFQYIPLPGGEITVDGLVEIFATVIQQKADVPSVLPDGQWGTRILRPIDPGSIHISVRVPAGKDPGDSHDRPYCNTGVLLVPGDELQIKASGTITVDHRQTWYNPYGIITKSVHPDFVSKVHPRDDTYRATGYPKEIFDGGDTGVVGSLIGWIQSDKPGLEQAFVVGSSLTKTLARGEEGFLHLAVNDTRGAYGDNEEAFDVSIEVTHPE